MGGRFSVSNQRQCFVTACRGPRGHHTGRRSIHSKHIEVRPLSKAGADGPLEWWRRRTLDDPFEYVGTSHPHPSAVRS
jgi:hypothetical protein